MPDDDILVSGGVRRIIAAGGRPGTDVVCVRTVCGGDGSEDEVSFFEKDGVLRPLQGPVSRFDVQHSSKDGITEPGAPRWVTTERIPDPIE